MFTLIKKSDEDNLLGYDKIEVLEVYNRDFNGNPRATFLVNTEHGLEIIDHEDLTESLPAYKLQK